MRKETLHILILNNSDSDRKKVKKAIALEEAGVPVRIRRGWTFHTIVCHAVWPHCRRQSHAKAFSKAESDLFGKLLRLIVQTETDRICEYKTILVIRENEFEKLLKAMRAAFWKSETLK